MKSNKKITLYIIFTFAFIILYILLASKPLGKEYHFKPEWEINLSAPTVSISDKSIPQMYFKLGQSVGYFTEDGKISLYKSFPSKASISSDYYSVYSTDDVKTTIFNNSNQELGTIDKPGFPFYEDDRIYLFLPGGASFSKCNTEGDILWTYENTIPLTAFSSKEDYTVAGYADGTINVIKNETGTSTLKFAPGGSDYKVILGIDVSSDGKYIASVSGHNKQRFVLTKNEDTQPIIVYHNFLNSDLQRRTLVRFCHDNRRVLYNYENHIGIYDIENQKSASIEINKDVIAIEETDSLIFVLGKKNNEYTVYLIEKNNSLEGSFTFTADTAFIRTLNNNLYVGHDSSISKIIITKE